VSAPPDAALFAFGAAACFALAMVANRVALRHMGTIAGSTISVPAVTVTLWLLAPWCLDDPSTHGAALAVFAAIGVLFPATVTLMIYEGNARLGPTLTATVSSTAPLFAFVAAVLFLGESFSWGVGLATTLTVAGIALLSWQGHALATASRALRGGDLLFPAGAALVRGASQVAMKFGLALWPSAYAALLVGYTVSSAVVFGAGRLAARRRRLVYTRHGVAWFLAVGACNGSAMFLMYAALARGEVTRVAPIVASYPLITLLLSGLLLREERFSRLQLAGIALTVAGVVMCVLR
jgi:drug/metabolite transporter (DMT)-like permease